MVQSPRMKIKNLGIIVQLSRNARLTWSGVTAIVSVQFILIWFTLSALKEDQKKKVSQTNFHKNKKVD